MENAIRIIFAFVNLDGKMINVINVYLTGIVQIRMKMLVMNQMSVFAKTYLIHYVY